MTTLTIRIPDDLHKRLKKNATQRGGNIEELIVERLMRDLQEEEKGLSEEDRLKRLYEEDDLFERPTEAEKQQYHSLPGEELDRLRRKLSSGKPLSEIIIGERREGY